MASTITKKNAGILDGSNNAKNRAKTPTLSNLTVHTPLLETSRPETTRKFRLRSEEAASLADVGEKPASKGPLIVVLKKTIEVNRVILEGNQHHSALIDIPTQTLNQVGDSQLSIQTTFKTKLLVKEKILFCEELERLAQ